MHQIAATGQLLAQPDFHCGSARMPGRPRSLEHGTDEPHGSRDAWAPSPPLSVNVPPSGPHLDVELQHPVEQLGLPELLIAPSATALSLFEQAEVDQGSQDSAVSHRGNEIAAWVTGICSRTCARKSEAAISSTATQSSISLDTMNSGIGIVSFTSGVSAM